MVSTLPSLEFLCTDKTRVSVQILGPKRSISVGEFTGKLYQLPKALINMSLIKGSCLDFVHFLRIDACISQLLGKRTLYT